jgi:predicted RNA-binding protein YlqC (UPF0109 family)
VAANAASELVEFVVRHLVSSPEEVSVRFDETPRGDVVYVTVASADVGRVIGRQGRTVNALRSLLAALEHTPHGRAASLEVLDPDKKD